MLPERKSLPHEIPSWVKDGTEYFITLCTRPRGRNALCVSKSAEFIRASLAYRQASGDLWVYLLLLMPDHLHAIMSFSPQIGMKKCITDWKRYAAVKGKIAWQRDFFDHRLRKDESYVEKAHYIRMNPVRAGLISGFEKWPYIWESDQFGRLR
ncbi:MAG: transposase [Pontiellaceae bacterium]|nr:transposase [Pontiellaceae bacterium]